MQVVGVIGAGQMGAGIAQTIAQQGANVLLADVDIALAEKAKAAIDRALTKLVARDKLSAAAAALDKITRVASYAPMADADLIIEAATEREEIKRKIFEAVGQVLRADAILASNTSSIPITRMAASSPDPARFIGLHFFNPVPVMGLIEVIPGLATSADTTARIRMFAESLGKQVVMAQDEPGFVVNRILLPMINEAVFVLGQGTANIADIDKGCRLGLNHPMGPLELADFVGLDTCLDIVRVLYNTTGDSKYRPAPFDISPLSTLNSCGSSSRLVRRIKAPTRVMRASPRSVDCRPSWSERPAAIDRNLYISKNRFARPTRRCTNRIGLPSSLRIAAATISKTGMSRISAMPAKTVSNIRLVTRARIPSGPIETRRKPWPPTVRAPCAPSSATVSSTTSPAMLALLSTLAQAARRSGGQVTTTRSIAFSTVPMRFSAAGSCSAGTSPNCVALARIAPGRLICGPASSINNSFTTREPHLQRTKARICNRVQHSNTSAKSAPEVNITREKVALLLV